MSKIDYVMGFLTADGYVSKDRHCNACSLILELSDKQIVEDIAKEFGKQHYYRRQESLLQLYFPYEDYHSF